MQTRMSDYKEKIAPLWETIQDHINMKCKWDRDDGDYVFTSECNYSFQFTDDRDSLTEDSFNFCPRCGGEIVDVTSS